MKMRYTHGALAIVVAFAALSQTAQAGTEVKSLPLQAVLGQAAPGGHKQAVAQPQSGADIALFFGDEAHPAVRSQLGDASESARIARRTDDQTTACNRALSEAVDKLRTYAHDHNANAIINIRTSFHSTETASATDFTCGVSGSAAALRLRGDAVVLETN
ncbi:MAG: signal peptidase [Paraburkholderia sp.]|uniref:signal peptidase n=1 Tax=Paraburkholderia sp. TaxID=1926495 RepID=UPI00122B309D|nr:signal peptidase [Paraburkholderia sp.]TAL96283.1 MAG: signal peptidase [Paraburkholderia sp.]